MQPPRAYWSSVAEEKTFTHPLRTAWLTEHVSAEAPILDVGCGYGRLAKELALAGWTNYTGADTSTGMLERARREHPDREHAFVRIEGDELPFERDTFAAVLLFSVLTCIPEDDEEVQLLREVERVLRPGGVLYASDLLLQTDARNVERYAMESADDRQGIFVLPEGVRLRHFSDERLEALFAPFDRLRFEPFEAVTMNGHRARAFQFLGRRRD